jgi:PAS domain S-box-containing protein
MGRENRYKQFFETAKHGILFLYADTGEIADVNPFFTELSGYTSSEIIRKSICETGLFKDFSEYGKFIEMLRVRKYYRYNNMALHTADGREVPVEFSAVEYTEDSKKMIRCIIHDISDRKSLEEKSKDSEQRYRNIFEHSCIAIVVSGPDSRIIDANPTAVKMFGLRSREDMLGKPAVKVYADPKQREAIFKELNAKGYVENIETELIKQDGSGQHIITLSSAAIHKNEQEDILWTVAMMIDITQRKKTEEALQQSEENLSALAENASDGILIATGEEGMFVYANRRADEITGYTIDEILKMRIRDLVSPDEFPKVFERYRKRIAGLKVIKPYEIALIKKDGAKVHVEVSPSKTIWQKEPAVLVIIRDIRERKQAEEKLAYQASLLSNVNDAIVASDAEYNLTAWNKAAEELYGWKAEEVLGRKGLEIVLTEWPGVDAEEMRRVIAREGSWRGEATQARKDGTRIPVEISSIVLRDAKGKIKGFVSVNRDITEHKRIEEELKHSRDTLRNLSMHIEETREKERAKIAMNLHDDLGQKLTALNIDLGWLTQKLSGLQPEILDKLSVMSELLLDSIQRIRLISSELRPAILDDLGLAEAARWQLEEFEKRTGIHCELTITPEEFYASPEVSVVIFRTLQEILTNIARHANATSVRIDLAGDEKAISMTVIDNGRGIKRAEINNPMSLGIIGMRERIKSSGGSFHIEGKEGKGTKVVIEIPNN